MGYKASAVSATIVIVEAEATAEPEAEANAEAILTVCGEESSLGVHYRNRKSMDSPSCTGFFLRPRQRAALLSYTTEFRKADSRRGADPFVSAGLYFVDVRERRLLGGAFLERLTPVIGGFAGRRCSQDAHIVHTAYRVFFELFLGLYVDAEYVEGLVEDLQLVPDFQRERKGYVYYVLGMKQLQRILAYVERTHEYTPFYERGLPHTLDEVLTRRTVGLSPRYMQLDGAGEILEDLKNKQVVTLVLVDVDEPRPVRVPGHGGRPGQMLGIDPFLLDDMDGIRCWLNNTRHKLLQALTRVSRKVVRRVEAGRLRAVFALTRRPATDPSIALVAKYADFAEERRELDAAAGGWFGKKLTRVVPMNVGVSTAKRGPAPTLEIIKEDVRDESHCKEGA